MKICTRCGKGKNVSEYHKNGSGHKSACKECTNARSRELSNTVERKAAKAAYDSSPERKEAKARYEETHEAKVRRTAYMVTYNTQPGRIAERAAYRKDGKRKDSERRYRLSDVGKEIASKSIKKQRLLYPERFKARAAVNNAVASGSLIRLPCWVCGELEVEGHHPAYSMPLDVVWLCKKHHDQTHNEANSGT